MTTEALQLLAVAALVIALLAVLLALWAILRTRSERPRPGPGTPADLRDQLNHEVRRLDGQIQAAADLAKRVAAVEDQGSRAITRMGLVRYNPFDDTGGQQSFALAMLDSQANGFVISSLHSRQQTRIYLKSIVGGKSDTALSAEEAQALRQAGVDAKG